MDATVVVLVLLLLLQSIPVSVDWVVKNQPAASTL